MAPNRALRKVIDNRLWTYDRTHDVIHSGVFSTGPYYQRTQVSEQIDLCIELTTRCNMRCQNCFSNSGPGFASADMQIETLKRLLCQFGDQSIRVCITGGEPMLHPHIDTVLALPESIADCGFVLSTNGTVRPDLDSMLVQYEWLVAISLHGMESTHNRYTLSRDFTHVKKRIEKLARKTIVHIYTTLHDEMTYEDLEWLFRFRDESGASFLRFVIPRQFGRYRPLSRTDLLDHLAERIDGRAGIKAERSNTRFATVDGTIRSTS